MTMKDYSILPQITSVCKIFSSILEIKDKIILANYRKIPLPIIMVTKVLQYCNWFAHIHILITNADKSSIYLKKWLNKKQLFVDA